MATKTNFTHGPFCLSITNERTGTNESWVLVGRATFFFQLLFLFWCLFRFLLFPVSVSYVQLHSLYSSRQEERKPSHYRPWIFFDFFSCFEVFFDFFSQVIRFSYVFFIHQAQLDVFHFCYFRVQLNVNVKNINRIHIHI